MKLSAEDKAMLEKLCQQHKVGFDKVIRLLDTEREYEFRERRTGVYDALRDILRSDMGQGREEQA